MEEVTHSLLSIEEFKSQVERALAEGRRMLADIQTDLEAEKRREAQRARARAAEIISQIPETIKHALVGGLSTVSVMYLEERDWREEAAGPLTQAGLATRLAGAGAVVFVYCQEAELRPAIMKNARGNYRIDIQFSQEGK